MIKKVTCLMVVLLFEASLQASQHRPRRIVARLKTLQVQSDHLDSSSVVGDQGAILFAEAFETRVSRLEKSMDHRRQENREIRRNHKQLAEKVESVRKQVEQNSRAFIGCFHFGPDIQKLKREHLRLEDRFHALSGEFSALLSEFTKLAAFVKKTES